jgi:DNA-binding MarR family transcriptional regulator
MKKMAVREKRAESVSHSLEQTVFLSILRAAELLKEPFNELFKQHDLTLVQFNVMRILRGAGDRGLTCAEVGERMINHDSDITRMLDRLESHGFVSRMRRTDDRRVVISHITERGRSLLAELDQPVLDLHERQLRHMSREKLEALKLLLSQLMEKT